MHKLVIVMISTVLLLAGCRAPNSQRQPTLTVPPAGTGALIDGATIDNATGTETDTLVGSGASSEIGGSAETDRRHEYRSGR